MSETVLYPWPNLSGRQHFKHFIENSIQMIFKLCEAKPVDMSTFHS